MIYDVFFTVALLYPAYVDIRSRNIPVEYVCGLGIVGLLWRILFYQSAGWGEIYGICIVLFIFGGQVFFSKGKWLGIGDIYLALALTGILGPRNFLVAIYFAYVIGGSIALIAYIFGFVKKGDRVPFAPALILGAYIALWFGDGIQSAILSLYGTY